MNRIPRAEFRSRVEETQTRLGQEGFAALLAFSAYQERQGNVAYLVNHFVPIPNVMSHVGLGYAALLLRVDSAPTLVAPLGYDQHAVCGLDRAWTQPDFVGELARAIEQSGVATSRIAVAGCDVIPHEYFRALMAVCPQVSFEPTDDILESQRAAKSPNEIELLREAARVGDKGLEAAMGAARAGASQFDVELAARRASLEAGADFIPRIRVVNGTRVGTFGWPPVSDRSLEDGDLVYVDLIGWCNGYGFDGSRVTVVGTPDERQREYLEKLVAATDTMIDAIKPGVRVTLQSSEMQDCHVTPSGHGIGLEINEQPWLTEGQMAAFAPNMVLAVEPTVFCDEMGGVNIEDMILVKEDGVEILSECPRRFW